MKNKHMLIENKEFMKLFKKKKRLCCAKCGDVNFDLTPTDIPDTTIEEAIFMTCINCEHKRLELV